MDAVRTSLPYAVAIVLSTAPILALVLVMVVTRPVRVSASFLLGWAAGVLAVAGALVAFVDLSVRPRLPDTAAAFVRIGLGGLLAVLAVRSWHARDATPKWLANLSGWTPSRALSVGFLLGSVNPKNFALVASGATAILAASAVPRDHAIAVLVFALVASAGIAVPIVLREVGGRSMNRWLERTAQWMTTHGKSLSAVVLAIIAVLLLSNGLSELAGRR